MAAGYPRSRESPSARPSEMVITDPELPRSAVFKILCGI